MDYVDLDRKMMFDSEILLKKKKLVDDEMF